MLLEQVVDSGCGWKTHRHEMAIGMESASLRWHDAGGRFHASQLTDPMTSAGAGSGHWSAKNRGQSMSEVEKQPTVWRLLFAKAVSFKAGRRKSWTPPLIHEAIQKVLASSPTIGDRHFPLRKDVEKGVTCYFINRSSKLKSGGILLEICVYTHGHIPESMTPDLDKKEAEIRAIEIKDEEGRIGELVHSFRCIAFGQVVILEGARGFGGGSRAFQVLLSNLFRRHLGDPTHPSLDLGDIGSSDLHALIKSRGGVSKVVARITQATESKGSKFGELLSSTRTQMPGAKRCNVVWDTDEILSEKEAVAALEEADDESLSGVTLHFKHGGSVSNLEKYRERYRAQIPLVSDGRVSVLAIEKALINYLLRLRSNGSNGPINADGMLVNTKLVSSGK